MGGVIRVLGMPIDGLINPGGGGDRGRLFPKTESKRKGLGGNRGGAAALGWLGQRRFYFRDQ